MNNTSAISLPHPNTRTGQGTLIEQSRAGAEVYASVLVAQQCPRNEQAALAAMREVCMMTALAERAFFRFSRGGSQVSGPSVHLARELARCWGNVQYGVAELRRDDEHGQSEMQAYAWDLQTNARSAAIFIVPHKRDKKSGPEPLTDMRDIYESNANAGARRVRECIFSVLPLWYVEEAKTICNRTLTDGGGKPLPQRISDAITAFDSIGIAEARLADKVGKPSGAWTAHDLAQLTVTYKSIQRGEVAQEEEFPTAPVTAAEITNAATRSTGGITTNQSKRIHAMLTEGGITSRDTKLALFTELLSRPVDTSKSLTELEADVVIRSLTGLTKQGPLAEGVAELLGRKEGDAS